MAKTKQQSHSEIEYWKGLVKKLKSENKNLRKRLRSLEKREHFFEEPEEVEESSSIDDEVICEHCGKGVIVETNFKYIIIKRCNICGNTERIKLNG